MTSNLDEARRPLKSVGNLTATLPEREQESWGRKKTHQRAVTAVRISELSPAVVGGRVLGGDSGEASSDSATATAKKSDNFPKADDESREQISTPRSASQKESPFGDYNDSGSSSESSSTVVGISHEARESRTKRERTASDTRSAKTNALQYLESDSPVVSLEAIRQSLTYYKSSVSPMSTSPSSRSTTSSHQSSFFDGNHSDFPDHDTDRSTSPEHSPQDRTQYVRPPIQLSRRHRSYGTPEMPRGTADLPHISPKVLTSRASGQSYGYMPLPRAEKLLPTGYEQLAYKLASQGSHQAGPYLRPMYRRFGMLNHRLLLHLQDELCELEEQLHRLDTTDTQTRRLHNGVLPASRRAEALAGGELAWHKTDILGKIGFKLEQYNRVLSSFKTTENFDTPTMADVHDYRGYLATHPLVAEPETRFLDFSEDLICTGATSEVGIFAEETATTPMPRRMSIPSNPTLHEGVADYGYFNRQVPDDIPAESTIPIKLIMVIAIVLPTLTFGVIPGYRGRMAVVVLVGLGMLGALLQIRKVGLRTTNDFCICAGAYGAIMAVIAGVCR